MTPGNWRVHALSLAVVGSLVGLAAAVPPKFEDFPVGAIFKGEPAPPRLAAAEARRFRTQLRRQASSGPDFAGHFKLALWGCAAGCVFVAVIDSITGDVFFAPFSFEDGTLPLNGGATTCHHASDFRIDSELFVVEGSISDKSGTHYYRWHDRKFALLHFEPTCSI